MSGKRRLRPGSAGLLAMMVVNGAVAYIVLNILFAVFGIREILPELAKAHVWAQEAGKWVAL